MKHKRNASDMLPPTSLESRRDSSAETKKEFLKRKKVYDPKEAIKK